MEQYQLFDALTEDEYKALKEDIRQRGVLVPVEYDETGAILDGHHRIKAWNELRAEGVDVPQFTKITRYFENEAQKRNHIRALNIIRRHLTKDQRAAQWIAMRQDGMSYRAIAETSGVEPSTVMRSVENSGVAFATPEKVTGKDGKNYPAKDRPKPPEAPQKSIFSMGDATTEKEEKQAEQKEARAQMHQEKRSRSLPDGKYQVIYADPPWQYDNSGFETSAENHYPTMPIEEICALPIKGMTEKTSILFLWATNPLLPEALKVINAWGFEYKTNLVWVKGTGQGIGWFTKSAHEILMIGVKEETPHPKNRPTSYIEENRTVHSRKPEGFYEIIESMYPEGKKIELFARNRRDGWDAWGNEV